MQETRYTYTIVKENAPETLKGKVVTAILTEKNLEFHIDMETEPTPQEAGYLKWFFGEIVDEMKESIKASGSMTDVENLFSLPQCSFQERK